MSDVPVVRLRSVVFDIETTNFNAESIADILVCASFLPLDEDEIKTIAITYKEVHSEDVDKDVLIRVMDYLSQFDIVIGHNIARFDLNWLTTRMMYHGIPFPRSVFYYDTYSASRRIGLRSWKNLGTLGAFFDLDGEKTRIFRPDWMNVLHKSPLKHKNTLANIVYHCEQDVLMNRRLFDILWAHDHKIRNLPYYDKWT